MPLWDGRFSDKPNKALAEFSESVSFDKRLYKYDIQGSIAHAEMLAESGIIPEKSTKQIISGLKQIEKDIDNDNLEFSSQLEDIHMHIENALINKIFHLSLIIY